MESRDSPERIMREMDWNLLRTFVVLAQSRSVTDAANRLRLTQPSVSTALKRLENRVEKRLIHRAPGRFELTEAGETLYREALDIQGAILRLSTLMRDMNLLPLHGAVVLTSTSSAHPKCRVARVAAAVFLSAL